MIDAELADKILQANEANLVKAVKAGKMLTAGQYAMLKSKSSAVVESAEDEVLPDKVRRIDGKLYAASQAAAQIYIGCTDNTFRKWRNRGTFVRSKHGWGPLDELKETYERVTSVGGAGNVPPPSGMKLPYVEPTKKAKAGTQGAGHALGRLEEMEAQAHQTFLAALKTGDQATIKFAHDMWIALLRQLRSFEASIDKEKREIGEVLPQVEVKKFCFQIGAAIARSGPELTKRIALDAAKETDHRIIAADLWKHVPESLLTYLDHALHASKLPPWAVASVKEGLGL